jgi:hypothetical protein
MRRIEILVTHTNDRMITEKDIESAYANMRKSEDGMFEATEEEIQARIMLDSLKAINVRFREPKFDEEWSKREDAWKQAEHNKRVAIHMHRMAKMEVQKNKDLLDFANLNANNIPDHYSEANSYDEADVAARNLKIAKAPKKKTIWGQ